MKKILTEISGLKTYFFIDPLDSGISDYKYIPEPELEKFYSSRKWLKGKVPAKAVDGVSLNIYEDEVLGIVGESGAGKSVTAHSITRLIPEPPGIITAGKILFKGTDLLTMSLEELHKYRGREIGMVFQEPMTSLNPVLTIEEQLSETIMHGINISRKEVFERGVEMLRMTGIPDAESRIKNYPHQFSGGMRQRIMIAMAVSCNPSLLIADEPTTALDVTVQAQILELMMDLKRSRKDSSMMMITHNLGLVSETCDRVIVMYCGKIQESGTVNQIFTSPKHPYTIGLMESLPVAGTTRKKLKAIPGYVPGPFEMPDGCKFCTRCTKATEKCFVTEPGIVDTGDNHSVRCNLYE